MSCCLKPFSLSVHVLSVCLDSISLSVLVWHQAMSNCPALLPSFRSRCRPIFISTHFGRLLSSFTLSHLFFYSNIFLHFCSMKIFFRKIMMVIIRLLWLWRRLWWRWWGRWWWQWWGWEWGWFRGDGIPPLPWLALNLVGQADRLARLTSLCKTNILRPAIRKLMGFSPSLCTILSQTIF